MLTFKLIINSLIWLGLGLNIAAMLRARRYAKRADRTLDEAQAIQERNYTLVQFSMDFEKCETADDIIDLNQRWHERLKEVGLDFNDIVKFNFGEQ